MNTIAISTDPTLLDVELPLTLTESPSVSTFLPEEDASICPLLSAANGISTPLTYSHPLTPCINDDNDSNSTHLCNEDSKVETSSSTGSSSGIGMDVPENTTTSLFNKHAYQHLQNNNIQQNDNVANNNVTLSTEAPSFVSWNWPLIRKFTFFVFISSLLAMCAVVVTMIVTLPKTCNPKTAWFRGTVFYEIFPGSFQDSNNDGIGDISGIENRVDYLVSLGIAAVRLNSIYPSPNYPDDYKNITSLTDVAAILGKPSDLRQLSETLHSRNISLVLDLPLYTYVENSHSQYNYPNQVKPEHQIAELLRFWVELGVDGFYFKELDHFVDDITFVDCLKYWKHQMGISRIIIISESTINDLEDARRAEILSHVDLVDVHLDVSNGTKQMEKRIQAVLEGDMAPTDEGVWIHWSIGGVELERITSHTENSNFTLAATVMQLMLPGTTSIFYGDEIALEVELNSFSSHGQNNHLLHLTTMRWSSDTVQFTNRETLPWLPQTDGYNFYNFEVISSMIGLRNRSPSIYKNSICKTDAHLPNTEIRRSHDDILIVERTYPRRNTFISISNFGQKRVTMDMTAMYYSGQEMLKRNRNNKIYFSNFEIGPLETIVVRLDK